MLGVARRGTERVVPLRQQAGSVMGIGNWHVADKQRMCAREKGKALGVWENMSKFCQNLKEMNRRKRESYDFLSNSEE